MSPRDLRLASAGLILAGLLPWIAVAADLVDTRLEKLRAHLGGCTQQHGYDPDANASVGQHQIAPGEANWRKCAYDGIRNIMIPDNPAAGGYKYLIAFDRTLTQEIQRGKITRAERKDRLQKAIDEALAKDRAAQSTESNEQEKSSSEADIQAARKEALRRRDEQAKMRQIQSLMR